MIRFIDIRGQGTGYRFAFWDTVCDQFCKFGNDQAWEDVNDFKESFDLVESYSGRDIDRFISLMPEWTATPMGENDELRDLIRRIFEAEAEQNAASRQQQQIEATRQELKAHNAPHSLGTVAEIAARYGVSKSEVRRRKADGTLEGWIEQTLKERRNVGNT